MSWTRKAATFRALDRLPGGHFLHEALQRYVTRRLPRSDKSIRSTLGFGGRLSDALSRNGGRAITGATFLEFGAGRDLALPLYLSASGAERVYAFDIDRLARRDLVARSASVVVADLGSDRPLPRSFAELSEIWKVDYRAPGDARRTGLASRSVDCAYSLETLEHIPRADIVAILREIARVLKADGLAIMEIDYTDHYAGFDASIGRFNFLRFDETEWARYQSSFQYVNRLRHPEYLDCFSEAGLEILEEVRMPGQPDPDVESNLAACFGSFTREDLFTAGALIVARPDPTRTGDS